MRPFKQFILNVCFQLYVLKTVKKQDCVKSPVHTLSQNSEVDVMKIKWESVLLYFHLICQSFQPKSIKSVGRKTIKGATIRPNFNGYHAFVLFMAIYMWRTVPGKP